LFGLLRKFGLFRTPYIAILCWISRPKQAKLLASVHPFIDTMIIPSSYQRVIARTRMGVPEEKLPPSRWFVDQHFWVPRETATDMISSAGREMRDYGTLVKAMEGLNIPCHIAASYVKGRNDAWKRILERGDQLPPNITVGPRSFFELREMYARSRCVVVPVLAASDSDNGVSVIMEAMAMGRPVICSSTVAQVDIVRHGVNGLCVPPEDPKALREAIVYLWNHPDEAQRMGHEGRRTIEQYHTIDAFVRQMKEIADEIVARQGGTSARKGRGSSSRHEPKRTYTSEGAAV
jgi:glycosyltransferase involved in cell wall biosynthesis